MLDTSTTSRRRILSPWDVGAPPLSVIPSRRGPLGFVPSRREVMDEQIARILAGDPEVTLDQLARRLGADAGDPDLVSIVSSLGCTRERRGEDNHDIDRAVRFLKRWHQQIHERKRREAAGRTRKRPQTEVLFD